jgi:mannose-6-phosphate isomerase class I
MTSNRKTTQDLRPISARALNDAYDLYPAFDLPGGVISLGFDALAQQLAPHRRVILDGFPGVFWQHVRDQLDSALKTRGVSAAWFNVEDALLPPAAIDALVQPFLGGDDPLFGTRFTGTLADFYDPQRLAAIQPDSNAALSIIYGCGASLAGWDGVLVYCDVPKNEIQFRFRAGGLTNLGAASFGSAKAAYKRCYFVDWVAASRHKADLLPRLDWFVDEQRPDEPSIMSGDNLRAALTSMSRSYFRARPWFEPGAWGGQWIKKRIPQLPQNVPNYAWSFELITPENGLLFRSNDLLLEASFDCLMFHDHRAVLGESADAFGYEFPIRFDFLDTFDGGNLSLQCHPRPDYIHRNFGETFTQDETYYILDAEPDAQVYLGFRANVDPAEFRAAAEASARNATPLDVPRFVNVLPARKHDLFLIPSGTIHCSGVNNLVLEISATPYIFTFKIYDWLRLDLDGQPRPLNIPRAFDNLRFDRPLDELVSQPQATTDPRVIHVPTHRDQFFDVHRLEFTGALDVTTGGSAHILSLVEGERVTLETAGTRQTFAYAETFVVPAAAERYRLLSNAPVKVIKAFVKPRAAWAQDVLA